MTYVLRLKKSKVIHMLYDLFPDALEVSFSLDENSSKSKLIGRLFKQSQKLCEATIYLGSFLQWHAEKRWGKAHISEVIDISTDLSNYLTPNIYNTEDKKLIIHYGGQLGHLHDAQAIIDAVKFLKNSDLGQFVEFVFYVSDAQAAYLESSLEGCQVTVLSAVPSRQWREDISNFHIGLVSLSSGGASVCLPSKSYAMMAGGLAILAICPLWSDLARMVNELDSGWVVNNALYTKRSDLETPDYLNNIKKERSKALLCQDFYGKVKMIYQNPHELMNKRENAYYGIRKHFDIEHLSCKWSEVLQRVQQNTYLKAG
ncbi:glycosyltransferase family protein [Mucilaginibacter ginkgonis]|uniref:Glycosyl transferase family 1 n=1 Tax=Mucilaginibacter ginkgonis TaxID=2682091 RepID=A0A6I4HZA1_9SPHI|nr:hypothetical protein [Mucilaginibacter ginkgonis]QQL50211.1 hypothetical protein GO620_001795 [Mucilaginibacter ginkgonis]